MTTATDLEKAREYNRVKKYEESLKHYQSYLESGEKLSEQDKGRYAWDIYFVKIKNSTNINEMEENVKELIQYTSQRNASRKDVPCAYTISILKLMKFYSDNITFNNNAYKLIAWADKLNPQYLSNTQGKRDDTHKYNSNKENWYLQITKGLFEIKKYNDVIKLSNEALETIPAFNNSNDIWFKYKIAKSYRELGEYDAALEYLEDITKVKKEWFFFNEIAINYFKKEDYDSSAKWAARAALSHDGKIESKLKLFLLIGDILKIKGYEDEYIWHKYLVYTIRNANEWAQEEGWDEELASYELDLENTDYKTIYDELSNLWLSLKFIGQERKYGTITKVFDHQKSGFIKSGKDSYYFNAFEFQDDKSFIYEGTKVSFFLEKDFNKKTGEEVENAVNIYCEEY